MAIHRLNIRIHEHSQLIKAIYIATLISLISACTHPHKVDIKLNESAPTPKTTSLTQAVYGLGLMTEIYNTDKLFIMARDITDNTGSSLATSAEVPRDITEMLKSTLNAFGGNIRYIPYDPEFIINSANTGYSGFNEKAMPNVVVSGGITEFDRGLETRGKNTDLSIEGDVKQELIGLDFNSQEKTSTSSITLDFNLIDFQTLAGIPRVQAINNIKVYKGQAEDSLGFSISGNAIGLQGNVKKVQGRHAAIRLLVQTSMLQLIGKHLSLPYWRLIPGAEEDPIVVNNIIMKYLQLADTQKASELQRLLVLHGYEVTITGVVDEQTTQAIHSYSQTMQLDSQNLDEHLYTSLYLNIPNTPATLQQQRLISGADLGVASHKQTSLSNDGIISIKSNGKHFKIGDEIQLSISLSAPRYLHVFNLSSTGEIWNLYPGDNANPPMLKAGDNVNIPSDDADYKLEITGPVGVDKILAIASSTPLTIPKEKLSNEDALRTYIQSAKASLLQEDIIIE